MPGQALVVYGPQQELKDKRTKLEFRKALPPLAVAKTARVVDEATGTAFDRLEA